MFMVMGSQTFQILGVTDGIGVLVLALQSSGIVFSQLASRTRHCMARFCKTVRANEFRLESHECSEKQGSQTGVSETWLSQFNDVEFFWGRSLSRHIFLVTAFDVRNIPAPFASQST